MSIKKSKEETIDELNKELYLYPIEKLYKADCMNWKGTTTNGKEQYSEVIAQELYLEHLEELRNITSITRRKSYYRENHCNIKINENNRKEENFAKRLYKKELETLGLIKDFQIPLKDTSGNKGIGKIDLISYNKNDKNLFLIELKYTRNKETLLRALLESYTYFKIVDKNKLITDFFRPVNPDEIKTIPAVLLAPGCNAYKELEELGEDKRPHLKKLSLSLGIKYFTIEELKTNEIHL